MEGPIGTEQSLPYCSAAADHVKAGLLKEYDYIEEEYFVSGTANVYGPESCRALNPGEDGWVALAPLSKVCRPDAPYKTRVHVIRPRDAADFSGIVHAIPFHPYHSTRAVADLDVFRSGTAWVGVEVCDGPRSAKPGARFGGIATLLAVDPDRYGSLALTGGDPADWGELGPGALERAAEGLHWTESNPAMNTWTQELYRSYAQGPDILLDLIEALRLGPGSVLPGFDVRRVYTYGASGGSLIIRQLVEHHHDRRSLPDGSPLIDGYLIGVGIIPTNRPRSAVLVIFQTEAEAMRAIDEGWGYPEDTDDPPFRYYELPGAGHVFSVRLGGDPGEGFALLSADDPAMAYDPYDKMNLPIMWGIWDGMHRWVEEGVALPRAALITRDPSAPDGVGRDTHGNALGGIRTPWVDVPDATYVARFPPPSHAFVAGMKRFSEQQMQSLYGSREEYRKRIEAKLQAMVADGWISTRDIEVMLP